jgi:hypothetical protein
MDVSAHTATAPSDAPSPSPGARASILGLRALGVAVVVFAVIAAVQLDAAIAATPGRFDATEAPPLPGLLLALSDSVAPWFGGLLGQRDAIARLRSVELVTVALVVLGVALAVVPRMPARASSGGR